MKFPRSLFDVGIICLPILQRRRLRPQKENATRELLVDQALSKPGFPGSLTHVVKKSMGVKTGGEGLIWGAREGLQGGVGLGLSRQEGRGDGDLK